MIVYKSVQNPGARASAYGKHEVGSVTCPSVSEVLKCRDEKGTRRIHPRKFIQKDKLTGTVIHLLQCKRKHEEGFHPVAGTVVCLHSLSDHRLVKGFQLCFQQSITFSTIFDWRNSRMAECDPAFECLIDRCVFPTHLPSCCLNTIHSAPCSVFPYDQIRITPVKIATKRRKCIS